MLTLDRAKELLKTTTTEEHLFLHAKNVSVAMGGMAKHFGENEAHWMAIGHLHDYDYEQYPEEHLRHTEEPLLAAGLTEEEVRAILAHGYTHINDVEPVTNLEKALFTVDELTGIIQAAARMRPAGPSPSTETVMVSVSSPSMHPIMEVAVSKRPNAAVAVGEG